MAVEERKEKPTWVFKRGTSLGVGGQPKQARLRVQTY